MNDKAMNDGTMSRNANAALLVVGAMGAGMLAMYLLDPVQGRRRRALAADRLRSASARVRHMADIASRDAAHRGQGLVHGLRTRRSTDDELLPQVLEERVRSRIGRAVTTPGAVHLSAQSDGRVTLNGHLLKSELSPLLSAVRSVRGVAGIENKLQVHDEPGNVSALQGANRRPGQGRLIRENWPPAIRVAAGAAGVLGVAFGLFHRPLGLVTAVLSGALVARAVRNQPLQKMRARPDGVHIEKDMLIAASPERVFDFWRTQENLPQFMRNVKEVRSIGDKRWHWKVAGPLGSSVEWDAEIIEQEENRRLAWQSIDGAAVQHHGSIEFRPVQDGTRIHVAMDYSPPAGALGHKLAQLFGKDAKTEMDEDLMRVKAFLETGVRPRDAGARQSQSAAWQAPPLLP